MLESIEQEKLRQGHEKIFKFSGQEHFGTGSQYSLGRTGIRCTTRDSPGRGGLIRWSFLWWWQPSWWWRGKHGWTSFKLWWCWWGHLCRWRKQCWSTYISILQVQGVKLCLMRYFSLLHQTSSKQSLWCDIWYIIYDIGFRYEFHVLDNAFLVHAPGVKTVQQRDRQMKPAKVDNPACLWDPKNWWDNSW